MRTIKFKPLRVIKKTGKITVASYMQWRSIKTADYFNFNLLIDESYKMLNDDDFVYNHNGKQLFFYDYNPGDAPFLIKSQIDDSMWKPGNNFIINNGSWWSYRMDGTDCDGVPTLSFYDADYIISFTKRKNNYTEFEPLTVGMVKMWFGWFLWQLDNSRLIAS